MSRESRADRGAGDDLRWSVERRLAFIENRLFWLGDVNRPAVVERFGVSMSQASADIARYLAVNGEGVSYDKSAKCYVTMPGFHPVLTTPDALRFLGELRLVEAGLLPIEQTMLGFAPAFDATPVPQRKIDADVLRLVLQAIRGRGSLDALYQSMSRPERTRRIIEPHALAFDGFRWHARAYDPDLKEFRDYVLGRLAKPRLGGSARSRAEEDLDWNVRVDLLIAPHPALTLAQSRAVALDYGMTGQSVKVTVRRALLFYALKRLGLDHDPEARAPNIQQIVLVNRADIAPFVRGPQY
jgi:predicted DNA-binding transcriptional regulator YafY